MKHVIRFSYVFLESLFKRIIDDGFASDKAIIVLGCAQIAAGASIFNVLIVLGVRLPNPNIGFGIALLLGLLVIFANYKIINAGNELEAYRNIYRQFSKTKKLIGGMAVIVTVVLLVISLIVTSEWQLSSRTKGGEPEAQRTTLPANPL
jgi:hypothetical protein